MALEVDHVAAAGGVGTVEKVVVANFIKRRGGGIRRDVAAVVAASHHRHRVPTDQAFDVAFDFAVAGEGGLILGGNGIDEGRVVAGRGADAVAMRFGLQAREKIKGPLGAFAFNDGVQPVEPILRLGRIGVGNGRLLTGAKAAPISAGDRRLRHDRIERHILFLIERINRYFFEASFSTFSHQVRSFPGGGAAGILPRPRDPARPLAVTSTASAAGFFFGSHFRSANPHNVVEMK